LKGGGSFKNFELGKEIFQKERTTKDRGEVAKEEKESLGEKYDK